MPFQVNIENPEIVERIDERINGMVADVAHLHVAIPAEFNLWQTEDMKRRFPNLEETGQTWIRYWTTRIWPRSRASDRRRIKERANKIKSHRVGRRGGGHR